MSIGAFRQTQDIMDGATAFAAAPVNGATGAPKTFYATPANTRGMILHVDIKEGTTFSLTFTIKTWNPYAATPVETRTILASAAKSANGGFELEVYAGVSETSNVSASRLMPQYWSLVITGTTDTCKMRVVAEYIP